MRMWNLAVGRDDDKTGTRQASRNRRGGHGHSGGGTAKVNRIPKNSGRAAEGGCSCGAVAFRARAEPTVVVYCHCRDCRRSSGAPISLWVGYRSERGGPDTRRADGLRVVTRRPALLLRNVRQPYLLRGRAAAKRDLPAQGRVRRPGGFRARGARLGVPAAAVVRRPGRAAPLRKKQPPEVNAGPGTC